MKIKDIMFWIIVCSVALVFCYFGLRAIIGFELDCIKYGFCKGLERMPIHIA